MKPIWRKAAVGTPAKQPIAVAVDQPPETSDDAVELEAWASMAAYCVQRFVHVRRASWQRVLTCNLLSNWERAFLNVETACKGFRRRRRALS